MLQALVTLERGPGRGSETNDLFIVTSADFYSIFILIDSMILQDRIDFHGSGFGVDVGVPGRRLKTA